MHYFKHEFSISCVSKELHKYSLASMSSFQIIQEKPKLFKVFKIKLNLVSHVIFYRLLKRKHLMVNTKNTIIM